MELRGGFAGLTPQRRIVVDGGLIGDRLQRAAQALDLWRVGACRHADRVHGRATRHREHALRRRIAMLQVRVDVVFSDFGLGPSELQQIGKGMYRTKLGGDIGQHRDARRFLDGSGQDFQPAQHSPHRCQRRLRRFVDAIPHRRADVHAFERGKQGFECLSGIGQRFAGVRTRRVAIVRIEP